VSRVEPHIARAGSFQHDVKHLRTLSGPRNKTTGAFLAIMVLVAAGCGAARPSKYYELAPPNDLGSTRISDPLPITLLIGRLKASHLYREDRIVYSTKSEQMGTYEYQRWAEPPTEMIEQLLLRELRASGHYAGIYSLSSERKGDYLLHGALFDFKEVSGDSVLARVTLDLELRDMKTGNTVWTHNYTHDEPVNAKNISAVVAALDRNVQRAVSEIRASLEGYFASRPSK
jgi:cholesterol transport system auxiliary component